MADPDLGQSSCSVSIKRDSMDRPIHFTDQHQAVDSGRRMEELNPVPAPTCVSMKSDHSIEGFLDFTGAKVNPRVDLIHEAPGSQQPDTQLDAIFMKLEENIIAFVKEELKMFYGVIKNPEPLVNEESKEQRNRKPFLDITLDFMRRMKQEGLAHHLQSSFYCGVTRRKLQSILQQRYQCMFEGIAKAGNPTLLNQIYTELYITEGGTTDVNKQHEVRRIETTSRKPSQPEPTIPCKDIFKGRAQRAGEANTELKNNVYEQGPIRTVMTMGVAGIGKTVLTQKFSLDWAEGRANRDIHLLFPFTFRELNVLKEAKISLLGLVNQFFSESIGLSSFENVQTVFIFDGLDECRFPLDFTKTLTDTTEASSVDVLLVNLIRGTLLPSARLWITTRPAAANQIPAECVSMVTEVRGFEDLQKEEYFRKRFRDEQQATSIISHIKTSRSLYAMCQIPVFCWITATVLEHVLQSKTRHKLPRTLTEMYIHFLVVQAKVKSLKYDGGSGVDPVWTEETKQMVESLGKLAFEQLKNRKLIFYESDLIECGLNPTDASVYSGVFTQVFKQESGLYQEKVYCFVHLSVQEFLAALHVHVTFVNTGVDLLSKPTFSIMKWLKKKKEHKPILHQTAVDQALKSPNGHWDLFLRFLLGLSQNSNEELQQGLLNGYSPDLHYETVKYIQNKLQGRLSSEKSINLFHCLAELQDHSLVDRVQQHIKEGCLSSSTSPALWAGVVFILLSSDNDLTVFDLKKYSGSDEALLRLLPVVKESNKAILTYCNLSMMSCDCLSSVLGSLSSSLRHVDISNNDLRDSGVELLYEALKSPDCRLETLKLSGCLVSGKGAAFLVSAVRSTYSHLKELDLSYNHPGAEAMEKLTTLQKDQNCPLDILRVEPAGEQWLNPGLKKYFCELTLDPNTVYRKLVLSADNNSVTFSENDQSYTDHPDRFDSCRQVLCSTGLTGRCYWEVNWWGHGNNWEVDIAVSYRGTVRKRGSGVCGFGLNDESWCLKICSGGYSVLYDERQTKVSSSTSDYGKVAVYLDYTTGSLSFFTVENDNRRHLHTFTTTFTEPLYAGFGFGLWSSGTHVSLVNY